MVFSLLSQNVYVVIMLNKLNNLLLFSAGQCHPELQAFPATLESIKVAHNISWLPFLLLPSVHSSSDIRCHFVSFIFCTVSYKLGFA